MTTPWDSMSRGGLCFRLRYVDAEGLPGGFHNELKGEQPMV
jgi:hypothetical protein